MSTNIRLASKNDAAAWLELVQSSLGLDYPAKEVYQTSWIEEELDASSGHETWVADVGGRLQASISLLKSEESSENPVGNLGRNLYIPESFGNGAAQALLGKITEIGTQKGIMMVARISVSNYDEMVLFENLGYKCVGFQPLKHVIRSRMGTFFYVHSSQKPLGLRMPLSESLSQLSTLAAVVLDRSQIPNPMVIRDGVTGYPLQSGLKIHSASIDDFALWKQQSVGQGPVELSTGSYRGVGFMRVHNPHIPIRAFLGQREEKMVAGLAYLFDEHDRCLRILDCFSTDDNSMGEIFQQVVKVSQEELSASYVEVDVLMTAPRLLKTADQLGFIPVAYFPAFFAQQKHYSDVVKMVKLNMVYSRENVNLTTQSAEIAGVIDVNFQDQKVGVAIINLLRGLPIFEGLGDGELRKISRLFTQKLYRPAENIFKQGDSSNEAYIVMRGQVDICLENKTEPIATIESGQIFGEVAFLDGSSRTAMAVARVPSILLVVQRSAFNELVQREPHLGMVVVRNMAIDLSNKLRRTNTTFFRKGV